MAATGGPVDLVLSGGGVLGIGHVGVVSVLEEHGYRFERIAGTSAGAIVGALLAAKLTAAELRQLVGAMEYPTFIDKDALDRIPLIGPALSVLREDGYAEGRVFSEWLAEQLAAKGVRTFADLRRTGDAGADPRPEHQWRLVVLAADVTRGELLRLPWDYQRYGLDPDEQPVVDAVRASMSVPYLFEPFKLRHAEGESLLVDGGVITNYPLDTFDRTDGDDGRWPTFGVTLLPKLPAGTVKLLPALAPLRVVPSYRFLEALVTTTIVGRDQGYLAQPWVRERSIEVDTGGVNPFDFGISPEEVALLYENGRAAAAEFVARRAGGG
jgi:NTE family protein